jgi:hypothetical protein
MKKRRDFVIEFLAVGFIAGLALTLLIWLAWPKPPRMFETLHARQKYLAILRAREQAHAQRRANAPVEWEAMEGNE